MHLGRLKREWIYYLHPKKLNYRRASSKLHERFICSQSIICKSVSLSSVYFHNNKQPSQWHIQYTWKSYLEKICRWISRWTFHFGCVNKYMNSSDCLWKIPIPFYVLIKKHWQFRIHSSKQHKIHIYWMHYDFRKSYHGLISECFW